MNISYILEGFVIGFSVGTTIGISGVLCLQNMMTGKKSLGLISVLAAALSDMTCGILALFGIQALEFFFKPYQKELTIVAGITLCFLGIKRLFEKVVFIPEVNASSHLFAAFAGVYFLGMIDPISVLDFTTLLLGLVLDLSATYNVIQFVIGIFLGSLCWWLSVFILIFNLKKGLSTKFFEYMQYCIGFGILFLGVWILWSALAL